VEPLKQRFAGPGQLLYGIHDHEFVRDAEVLDQICVRDFVDARLVAAEIDGNPVGSWWFSAASTRCRDVIVSLAIDPLRKRYTIDPSAIRAPLDQMAGKTSTSDSMSA